MGFVFTLTGNWHRLTRHAATISAFSRRDKEWVNQAAQGLEE